MMIKFRNRLLAELASVVGPLWVRWRVFCLRSKSRPLNEIELQAMRPHFTEDLLAQVRIAEINTIDNPKPLILLSLFGVRGTTLAAAPAGMALGHLVLLADQDPRKFDPMSLLFHELVHVAQYNILGTRGFVRQYIKGWARSGFDYFSIPLEQQAYELQAQFDAGMDQLDVDRLVQERFGENNGSR